MGVFEKLFFRSLILLETSKYTGKKMYVGVLQKFLKYCLIFFSYTPIIKLMVHSHCTGPRQRPCRDLDRYTQGNVHPGPR